MIYELKRYKIRDGQQEDFLEVWRPIVKLRKKHGYDVLFALFDRESGWFTWAVTHNDFDAANKRYYADPDRVKLDKVVDYVEEHEIKRVEFVPIP
jgi:hypothetical protein